MAFLLAAMVLAPTAGLQRVAAQGTTSEDKTATVTPADALVYASINLDTKSDQFTLATDLLKRAGLDKEVETATSSASSEDQATLDAVTGGYAAVVLTSLPAEFTGSLDEITSEASSAASDPTSLASGKVPSGFAVILQSSDPDKVETLIKQDLDKDATTETYEGVEITVIPADSDDDTGTAYARVGDFFVIGTVADDLHPIIDTESGKTDNLASTDAFTTLKGELNAEWLAFGLVNGPAILKAVETNADATVMSEIPAGTLAQLNTTTGFVFWADKPGFRMDTVSLASADAPAAAATPAVSGDFASKVPADTLVFTNGMNINQYGILDALGLVFAQALVGTDSGSASTPVATPASMAEQEAAIYAQAASMLGFNLKTDFIDQLDGEYGFAVSASDLTSDSPKIDAIFVTDTKNAQKVTDVASKISFILAAGFGSEQMTTREVGGASITSINAGDSSMPLTFEYGVVDGQLLIGVNDGIDNYVNGPTQTLASTDLYKETLGALPGDATGITFVNLEQITPLIAELESASGASGMLDASDSCAKFDTQEEAQAAYDEDSFANFDLDMNGNGKACEDYFAAATPEASPAAAPLSGLKSVGSVTYVKDGHQATSTIILIGE